MSNKPKWTEYPICPHCGMRAAVAAMTSHGVGQYGQPVAHYNIGATTYYHPEGLSLYCTNADCNYDMQFARLTTPIVTADEREQGVRIQPVDLKGTDGETYNRGRSEGLADVAVELRSILDPEDENKWNIDGVLNEVRRLCDHEPRSTRLTDYDESL